MLLEFKIIEHDSPEYWKIVNLRDEILRKPLGLAFTNEELLAENNQIHFGAYFNGKLLGCLILVEKENLEIKMRQVCIDENYQGKGIGFKMVLFSEKYAKQMGFKSIFCHARNNALPFYKKLNYNIVGDKFEEVGLEHYKLVKSIS